jgi:hypothetical protein
MKIFIMALSLFIFSTYTFAQLHDTIQWSTSYKLKWEDFQGKSDSSSKYGAISRPGIKYHLSANADSFNVKVLCFFIKSKSWSKYKNSYPLLMHEQLHFDIAELFARKLRKTYAAYKFNYETVGKDI